LILAACAESGAPPSGNTDADQAAINTPGNPLVNDASGTAADGSTSATLQQEIDLLGAEVFSLTVVNNPADEIYLVIQNDRFRVFDYTGDAFDQGADCFVINELDSSLQPRLSLAPGAVAFDGVVLPPVDVSVLNKAPDCSAGNGADEFPILQQAGTASSTHAQVQQRFRDHPVFQALQAAGDTYDFSNSTAAELREYLSGSMVTVTSDVSTNINPKNEIRRYVFCPGGQLFYTFTRDDAFFSPGGDGFDSAILSDEDSVEFRGYWDVAQFSGIDSDGTPLNSLIVMNMLDISQNAASQGQTLPFPANGQPDSVFNSALLTSDSEALVIEVSDWIPVGQVLPQGIVLPQDDKISPREPAPPICG
jgi:hypothetical protein